MNNTSREAGDSPSEELGMADAVVLAAQPRCIGVTLRPQVIPTTYGKFLAVSPPDCRYRIGVIEDTAADAIRAWHEARQRWEAIGDA